MSTNKIRIEDDAGNMFYPHTTTDVVFRPDGSSLESALITYKDVTNLSATTAGVISWLPYSSNDATMTDIVLYRATKDISNYDYKTCSGDSSVVGQQVSKDTKSYSYTGLTNNTQYWVKVFVRYQIGGGIYYSNGVTVTFTTPSVTITEFYNAGNEFTAITGGWRQGFTNNFPPSSITKNSNFFNLYAESTAGAGISCLVTTNAINFANIKTLKAEVEAPHTTSGYVSVGLSNQDATNIAPAFRLTNTQRRIVSLDVTNITTQMYVAVQSVSSSTSSLATTTLKVYRVWGES